MPWLQLILDIDPDSAEPLSELLEDLGAAAVTLQDGADQPLYEPPPGATPPGATPLWQHTRLVALFDADTDLTPVHTALDDAAGSAQLRIEPLEDRDWLRAGLENFKPLCFGERLWVCPSWHAPPAPDAVNVILDPGLAFGTGTHPTTAMCLAWLDANPPQDQLVIDYGCGSGILAVAAAMLGARHVHAVDNDPQALVATRQNAARNGVDQVIDTSLPPDATPDPSRMLPVRGADLVVANILAGPLVELAAPLSDLLRPGGTLLLSGILQPQVTEVCAAYPQVSLTQYAQQDDWACLVGTRGQPHRSG
ncbi:MAG: 50S ribosomal protein L11 methyltransferase [Pseudomonadota bacterium]|nr:MAG: 50S ribosomal protein L11 methyltransferase [Pseudomonadota bacterium]